MRTLPWWFRSDDFLSLFCADRLGDPIEDFGAAYGTPEAEEMNCECAFARRYMPSGTTKPACLPNGNYKPEQCHSGFCYCVDEYGRQVGPKEVDQIQFQGCDIPPPGPEEK